MDVKVNERLTREISEELHQLAKNIFRLGTELEEVEQQLKRQTEFEEYVTALKLIEAETEKEGFKLRILAQSLEEISQLYSRTEQGIEGDFIVIRRG